MTDIKNCGKGILLIIICMALCFCFPIVAKAETVGESAAAGHGVTLSPDGQGWTMDAGVQAVERMPMGTIISTGKESVIEDLEAWQHLYDYRRQGNVPVGQWKVTMSQGYCCHNLGDESYSDLLARNYLGLNLKATDSVCKASYMPAWTAICADCKEPILASGEKGYQTAFYLYGSPRTVSHLDSVDVNLDYYYLCPFCAHIEQGAGKSYHDCKKISTNRYRVVYLLSAEDRLAGAGGSMLPSIHMYNNDTAYDGRYVIPQTTLNPNTYTYPGHVVKEWVWTTLNEDGSYTTDFSRVFAPEAEILNLSMENWKDETSGGGTVYLTAVWKASASTLKIDANGGKYRGKNGITSITQEYATKYTVNIAALTPPVGYKVNFVPSGGKLPDGITTMITDRKLDGLAKGSDFQGTWSDVTHIYVFFTPNGHTDTLTAKWADGSIILPTPEKEGYGFGGWYSGSVGENYIGTGGDMYTPTRDTTLYAKWVDLTLMSTDNYTDNGGMGAVDLRWFWGEADQGSNKAYLLYQRKEGGDWMQIDSQGKNAESVTVSGKFTYSGVANKTYTIPYSGVYTLTAAGAQGATTSACEGKAGGKGGEVTARVWLNEGDVLTYTCGGQGGFNGGGSATNYGVGGGYSIISSGEKGLIMIAGGGGGATPGKDGGEGGYEAAGLSSSYKGQSGTAGGGGGASAGTSGNYEKHEHDEGCILIEKTDYSLFESGWWSDYRTYVALPGSMWYGRNDNYKEGTVTSDLKSIYLENMTYTTLEGHSVNMEDENGLMVTQMLLELGAAYGADRNKTYPSFSEGYIPVRENTTVGFDFIFNARGDLVNAQHIQKDVNRMQIYNQDNRLIYDKPLSAYAYHITPYNEYHTGTDYFIRDTFTIPAGTTSVYFSCYVEDFVNTNRMLTLKANSITFNGGVVECNICGYEEGQILSDSVSGGGGSWVNKDTVLSYTIKPGNNSGNGYVDIASELVGFVDDLALLAVPASDETAPEGINKEDVRVTQKENGVMNVSWPSVSELTDNKTLYEHKVVACNVDSDTDTVSVTSNLTVNYLGKIKGFYVKVDNKSNTILTSGTLIGDNSVEVRMTHEKQYLHIAVVDIGDNVSATTHIALGTLEEQGDLPVWWPITTSQLQISGENGLFQKDEKTYYVRADGSFPFMLHYQAQIEGAARMDYQINQGILIFTSGSMTGRDVMTIRNSEMLPEVKVPEGEVASLMWGAGLLAENQYVSAKRSNYNRVLDIDGRFVLPPAGDARMIRVIPRAGADTNEGTVYSDEVADSVNDLYLIGDGTAPDISGLEALRECGSVEFNEEGVFRYSLTAADAGSGVGAFYAVIRNKDNGLNQTFNSADNTVLTLEVEEDNVLLAGDVEIIIYVVDRVGNVRTEQVDITDFSLYVTAERILAPHNPVFKAGESGILKIQTYGYVSRIEVEYPIEWREYVESPIYRYDYTGNSMRFKEEKLQFMVPIELEEESEYCFVVKAFKGDYILQAEPQVATICVKGSVLDELRTRLR